MSSIQYVNSSATVVLLFAALLQYCISAPKTPRKRTNLNLNLPGYVPFARPAPSHCIVVHDIAKIL